MRLRLASILFFVFLFSDHCFAQWSRINVPSELITETKYVNIAVSDSILFAYQYGSDEPMGLFRSLDKGLTWIRPKSGLLNNHCISKIYSFGSLIIADCSDSNKVEIGYFRSTDYGDTWQDINSVLTRSSDESVFVQDKNNDIISFSSPTKYKYKSTDGGITWIKNNINYFGEFSSIIRCGDYLVAIGYVSGIGLHGNGIYFSTDEGETWSLRTDGIPINPLTNETTGHVLTAIDKTIFIGTADGVYKTTDYGINWIASNIGIKGQSIYKLIAVDKKIIANNFESYDLGLTWNKLEYNQTPDHVSNYLYCNYINYTLGISNNKGFTWNYINNILPYTKQAKIDKMAVNANNIFIHMTSGKIYLSSNYGNDWSPITLNQWNVGDYLTPDAKSFKLGRDSYYSTDNGNTWQNIELPQISWVDHARSIMYGTWCFTVCGRTLILGRSGGVQGAAGNVPQCSNGVTQVYGLETNEQNVYAASNCGISRSANGGVTWDMVLDDFHADFINTVRLIIKRNYVLACSLVDGLAWLSKDNGSIWDKFFIGFNHIVDIGANDNFLFVATSNNEIWERPVSELLTGVNEHEVLPAIYKLEQNYPNPFNPTTTIEYQVPKQSKVVVRVMDLLGREIETLVNEEKSAGNYSVKFDGSNFSSGVYFYQLIANGNVITKKFVLMK